MPGISRGVAPGGEAGARAQASLPTHQVPGAGGTVDIVHLSPLDVHAAARAGQLARVLRRLARRKVELLRAAAAGCGFGV